VGKEMGVEMVKVFLSTAHTEGLEKWRRDFLKNALVEIAEIDSQNRK